MVMAKLSHSRLSLAVCLLLICCSIRPVASVSAIEYQTLAGEPSQRNDQKLSLDKALTREIAKDVEHFYNIDLSKGQFLQLVVVQHGIDLVVTVQNPQKKTTLKINTPNGAEGPEQVMFIAETAGAHSIQVTPSDPYAWRGRYTIRIEELRVATINDRKLAEALRLFSESIKQQESDKYDAALVAAKQALAIRETLLGASHPDVGMSLYDLAYIYGQKKSYIKSEALYKRAIETFEKAGGQAHPYVALAASGLASLYDVQEEHIKAEPLYQRALAVKERAYGLDHPAVARSLIDLADLYETKGDYAKAEPLYRRALAIDEKALGAEHPAVAVSLHNLALLYETQGEYAKAEPLYQRALAIAEKAYGSNHPEVGTDINSLASLYETQGEYAKAEPLYRRALAIQEKAYGLDHPDVAITLNNLAFLYEKKGEYAKAEPLYRRALAIRQKTLNPAHTAVSVSLNNLAFLYEKKGDYAKAEPLYQQALAIDEKAYGSNHPETATVLHNLARLYDTKGDYTKAESLNQRVLAIREKALGAEHPDVAISLNNLALVYAAKGDYAKAEPLYRRALAIDEKALGTEHPNLATVISNLAWLYYEKGEYAKAEPLCRRALAIREKALGAEHPDVASSLSALSTFFDRLGNTSEAFALRTRSNKINDKNITQNLITGSERQKFHYFATFSVATDRTVSLHTQSLPNDPAALRLAFTTILRRKGITLDAVSDSMSAIRRRANPQDRELLARLVTAHSRLATMTFRELSDGDARRKAADIQSIGKEIQKIEEEIEEIEGALSLRSAEFRAQTQAVTLEALQAEIPAGAALVEWIFYAPYDARANKWLARRYIAYILRDKGEPMWVDLGEAKIINELVKRFRRALANPSSDDKSFSDRGIKEVPVAGTEERAGFRQIARELDEKVLAPIRKLVGNVNQLLLSPDGNLNVIPFAALIDEQNQFLIERYSITYVSTGRDLLRLKEKGQSTEDEVLLADPNYDNPVNTNRVKSPQGRRSADFKNRRFTPLPGVQREVASLKTILVNAKVLVKERATETALKRLSKPKILHIATHGFFLEDAVIKVTGDTSVAWKENRDAPKEELRVENPLLRSGLALAGANSRKSRDEDGVLTALEVSGLDLWGTKLVVLSACETGLGDVRNGEGVYGLRRALILAGSETQVMSLWQVNDQSTMELMIGYYKGLRAGQGRAEALRQAQLNMLKIEKRKHPFYWASFIQSGEWANLQGKR
jgi:CHAT domain-containing protein/Tfp pilus assembly protein PilF